jgi:hypothetical protein
VTRHHLIDITVPTRDSSSFEVAWRFSSVPNEGFFSRAIT